MKLTRNVVLVLTGLTFLWAAYELISNWNDLFELSDKLVTIDPTLDPKIKKALQNDFQKLFMAVGRVIGACFLTVLGAIVTVWVESSDSKEVAGEVRTNMTSVQREVKDGFGNLAIRADEKFNQVSRHFGVLSSLRQVTGNHYENLRKLAEILEKTNHKDLYIPLINYCFDDANKGLTRFCRLLEDGEFSETRRENFYRFVQIFFNYVGLSGQIRATSIVDPKKFWSRPEAIAYLNDQQQLIKNKGIELFRYFLIAEGHRNRLKEHVDVIRLNLERQMKVRVVFLKDKTPGLYEDIGLIDKTIAVKNDLDTEEDIKSSKCCLCPNEEIDRMWRLFINFEENPLTIKLENTFKVPGDLMNFDALWNNEIIKAAETKITLLDKLSGKQI